MNTNEFLQVCAIEESIELGVNALKLGKKICKNLRFGSDNLNPITNATNEEEILDEAQDLIACLDLLRDKGIIKGNLFDWDKIEVKKQKRIDKSQISRNKGILVD